MAFRRAAAACVALLGLLAPVAPAAADGMPAYALGTEYPEEAFGSLFESRQLALVDLVNDTHERISLFLSVFSVDPGRNLTIMVPLRTLPVDVTGAPMKESEFRETYKVDRAEDEVVRQDIDDAWSHLRDETAGSLQGCFGSMALSLPGEYIREKMRLVDDDDYRVRETLGGGEGSALGGEPEPVQHYEFDGFSIDVFGVGAGPRLSDYLLEKGLVMPSQGELERYNAHYLAIVEGATKPPIDEDRFALLLEYAPNTTASLVEELRRDPVKSPRDIHHLKDDYLHDYFAEMREKDWSRDIGPRLQEAFEELVDALFGSTDFEGEVLHIELPLDSGKVFFPLGTSAGWPNAVGDIDVLFRVPEGKDLKLPSAGDAFFDGGHWYLFQMANANPSFDLESAVTAGDAARREEADRAAFLHDHGATLAGLTAALAVLAVWFGMALVARRVWGGRGPVVRGPAMWLMLGGALCLSVPGAVLVYLFMRPVPAGELPRHLAPMTALSAWPVAMGLFVLGALL